MKFCLALLICIQAAGADLLGDFAPLDLDRTWKYKYVTGHLSEDSVSDYWTVRSVDSSASSRRVEFEVRRIGIRRIFAQGQTILIRGELISASPVDTTISVAFSDSGGIVTPVSTIPGYTPFLSRHWLDSASLKSVFFKDTLWEGKPAGIWTFGSGIVGTGMIYRAMAGIGLINGTYKSGSGYDTHRETLGWLGFEAPPSNAIRVPFAKPTRLRSGRFPTPLFSGHAVDGRKHLPASPDRRGLR